ncbi:tRNA modification GTPase [Planctomicrobium piriforme]|uniref:tRNA modification GTPase MnmE n=1 Tax=Planctomicrobium piriforme TaxID=1576369 RepID=A0A1I3PU99_9PLAN|nr:tRNA modification GTPase [Planctomicrobium piriforme]SFJ25039.1 tRNA modification GTPase [Planctomicrobium piriforme]
MAFCFDDTIAAIASAPGPALRGLIRISGANVREVLERLLGSEFAAASPRKETSELTGACGTDAVQGESNDNSAPHPRPLSPEYRGEGSLKTTSKTARQLSVAIPVADGTLQLPAQLLYWPNRRSFTGEPLAELHLPGSPPLLEEVLARIFLCGARPAERGEFTLRAFLAGRIDLVQAEAVLGVIDAADPKELETALSQLGGGISLKIALAREQLLLHLADLEAGLDFVEEDIEFVSRPALQARLDEALQLVQGLLNQTAARMLSTGRLRVVLAGLPNAGKSTLFNLLLGADAALVSPVAGTTRDYLTGVLNCDGTTCDLVDTAGWETARDGIEEAAALLREDQFDRAQLIVWCTAADLTSEMAALDARLLEQCRAACDNVLQIATKSDLAGESRAQLLSVSAGQGSGIAELRKEIAGRLSTAGSGSEIIGSTAARCEESLRHAWLGIERARGLIDTAAGDELIALELREVLEHLGRIVGQTYTDDILDRIFSRFCIGK